MSDGFVVASCGLYFPMVAKSPESQTTVVPRAFSWSRELVMILDWSVCVKDDVGGEDFC